MTLLKNKIVIVDNSVAITGALKAIINASLHLKESYHFVFVLPVNSTATPYVVGNGFQVHHLPFIEINRSLKNLILYLPYLLLNGIRLRGIIERHGAQVVHMNDFYNLTGLVAKIFCKRLKLITHVRFLPQKFMPSLAKIWATLNLRYADQVICVSQAVKAFFPNSVKIIVIPDPTPEQELHPMKTIVSNDNSSEVKLLYLSNYIRGKGQDLALSAFKKAYQVNPSLRLTFAGGDMGLDKNRAFKLELMQEVQFCNLDSVVKFEDFVQDVEAKIKSADILLNFSESESFSLTCLDALYYGTPLIASDCGGPAELFVHNKSGYLVPNMDVSAMADAILSLSADADKQRRFAYEGKVYVRNKFDPDKTFKQLAITYNKTLLKS